VFVLQLLFALVVVVAVVVVALLLGLRFRQPGFGLRVSVSCLPLSFAPLPLHRPPLGPITTSRLRSSWISLLSCILLCTLHCSFVSLFAASNARPHFPLHHPTLFGGSKLERVKEKERERPPMSER